MTTAFAIIAFIAYLPFAAWLKAQIYQNGYGADDYCGYGFVVRFIRRLFKK